jgi:hypothetical protein
LYVKNNCEIYILCVKNTSWGCGRRVLDNLLHILSQKYAKRTIFLKCSSSRKLEVNLKLFTAANTSMIFDIMEEDFTTFEDRVQTHL